MRPERSIVAAVPPARRGGRLLVLLALATLAAGCSWFSWLPFVGDGKKDDAKAQLKPAKLERFDAEVRIRRSWRRGVGSGLGKKYLKLPPALLADRIIAADAYGIVQAHDRFSGKRLWRTRIDPDPRGLFNAINVMKRRDESFVMGGVGAGAGMVLMGTARGEVIALSAADGSELWRSAVGAEVLAPPAVSRDAVLVQTIDGRLQALEQDTGKLRWSYDNQVPVLTLRGTSTPVVDQEVVYAGFANGVLVALRAGNGEPIWDQRIMLPEGRSELDRMVDIDGAPLLSGPIVYAAAYQGRVKALRRNDGQPLWEHEISSYLDMAEGYGQLYVVDEVDTIHAIDQRSADVVWTNDRLRRRKLTAPIAFSNYLAVGDADGYLHILAQSDGRFLGRRKLDGDGLRSPMRYADGVLYVLDNDGGLHALEIEVR